MSVETDTVKPFTHLRALKRPLTIQGRLPDDSLCLSQEDSHRTWASKEAENKVLDAIAQWCDGQRVKNPKVPFHGHLVFNKECLRERAGSVVAIRFEDQIYYDYADTPFRMPKKAIGVSRDTIDWIKWVIDTKKLNRHKISKNVISRNHNKWSPPANSIASLFAHNRGTMTAYMLAGYEQYAVVFYPDRPNNFSDYRPDTVVMLTEDAMMEKLASDKPVEVYQYDQMLERFGDIDTDLNHYEIRDILNDMQQKPIEEWVAFFDRVMDRAQPAIPYDKFIRFAKLLWPQSTQCELLPQFLSNWNDDCREWLHIHFSKTDRYLWKRKKRFYLALTSKQRRNLSMGRLGSSSLPWFWRDSENLAVWDASRFIKSDQLEEVSVMTVMARPVFRHNDRLGKRYIIDPRDIEWHIDMYSGGSYAFGNWCEPEPIEAPDQKLIDEIDLIMKDMTGARNW